MFESTMINVKVNPENHERQRNKTSNDLFQCIIHIKPQEVQYTQHQCLYGTWVTHESAPILGGTLGIFGWGGNVPLGPQNP